jgi:hypothetical protein
MSKSKKRGKKTVGKIKKLKIPAWYADTPAEKKQPPVQRTDRIIVSEVTYQKMLSAKYAPPAPQGTREKIISSSGGTPSAQNDKAANFPGARWV